VSALARILLVEDKPHEWQLALSGLPENGLLDQTAVVKDKGEALDFLHARGPFRRRAAGLPAVVVLGPSLSGTAALALLADIRSHTALRRVPVVIVAVAPDADMVRSAYENGVNSLVRSHEDVRIRAERYAALALFWGWANEAPPGCLRQPKSLRRGL
jgi:CheY-like chemotaxis protein